MAIPPPLFPDTEALDTDESKGEILRLILIYLTFWLHIPIYHLEELP